MLLAVTGNDLQLSAVSIALLRDLCELCCSCHHASDKVTFKRRRTWQVLCHIQLFCRQTKCQHLLFTFTHVGKSFDALRAGWKVVQGKSREYVFTCWLLLQAQHQVLRQMKGGDLDNIILTAVAEEGLDMKECQLVLRCDRPLTALAFVQSR